MKSKSKTIGYVLAIFLGFLGAHAFYYGRAKRGVLYVVLTLLFTPAISMLIGWIDTIYLHKWHQHVTGEKPIATKPTYKTDQPQPIKKTTTEVSQNESESIQNQNLQNQQRSIEHSKKKGLGHFYPEKDIILPKYEHIQTPEYIIKEVKALERNPQPKKSNITVNMDTGATRFFKDSIKYRYKVGKKSREIPLKQYFTTYSHLSQEQKSWYFYWRNEVLEGRYPDVDLSYLMLFTYELINYSFNRKAAFNISMMERLYEAYDDRIPKLHHYLGGWIADMLLEMGEAELAKEWQSQSRNNFVPQLYKDITNQKKPTDKISITTWKPFIKNQRETPFFQEHKNQIYKVFKASVPILKEILEEEGNILAEYWFSSKTYRDVKPVFNAAVMARPKHDVHVYYEHITPTDELTQEVTALFKLSENIVREINGESRKIKVNEEALPEELKERIQERFGLKDKQASIEEEPQSNRFSVVQKSVPTEEGEIIPPPPKENKPEHSKTNTIAFDIDKIRYLQNEQESMIQNINKTMDSAEEQNRNKDSIAAASEGLIDVETQAPMVEEKTIIQKQSLRPSNDFFSAFGDEPEEDTEAFVASLSDVERTLLSRFEDGKLSEEDAAAFLKTKGFMLGMVITDLNEKAEEYLGDNLLETQENHLVIHEEFEDIFEQIKESD